MTDRHLELLLIDDDVAEGILLRRSLEATALSFHLEHCREVHAGLVYLESLAVDAILLDYYLGVETGLTVLDTIRAQGYRGPVIMLTGQGDEQLAVRAMHAGASDYLSKAVLTPSSIQRAVLSAIEKHSLQKQIDENRRNLERTNADLERRNREIQSFYHTVSHELKTPLTSIREFVSIVRQGLAGPISEAQYEYLGIASESCDQMVACIEDMLDVTRLETGKLSLAVESCDPVESLERIVRSLEPQALEAGVELAFEAEPELPSVDMDPLRIAQVIGNLVSNALKFTPEEGRVCVAVARDQRRAERVQVTVADNGRGIPAEMCEQIFERLHQVSEGDYSTHGGLGLGLSICRDLVELHGGTISVASEEDLGSTFQFSLPTSPEHGASTNLESPPK